MVADMGTRRTRDNRAVGQSHQSKEDPPSRWVGSLTITTVQQWMGENWLTTEKEAQRASGVALEEKRQPPEVTVVTKLVQ